jgi:hypothetical protein
MTSTAPLDTTLYLPYSQQLHLPAVIYKHLPTPVVRATRGSKISDKLTVQAGVEGIKTLGQLCQEHVQPDGWFLGAE